MYVARPGKGTNSLFSLVRCGEEESIPFLNTVGSCGCCFRMTSFLYQNSQLYQLSRFRINEEIWCETAARDGKFPNFTTFHTHTLRRPLGPTMPASLIVNNCALCKRRVCFTRYDQARACLLYRTAAFFSVRKFFKPSLSAVNDKR